ncbi:MAG: carboxypeptidase-like regulatory domain-containing protein [Acidobacteria bacterium]|nr:carboxypeptidase-like regulatory domain-containing protein [Acidobacteriota bacterium]
MPFRSHQRLSARKSGWTRLWSVILLIGLFLLTHGDVRADLRGRIRGTIRDLKGKPAPGLLVRLTSPNLGVVHVTDTDGKGVYGFDDLPAGTYDVEVTGSGYQHQVKKGIVVQPPFRNIVDFSLPPGPISSTEPSTPVVYQPIAPESVLRDVLGTITDKDRRPIPDALISLVNPTTGVSFRARSSREGKSKIEGVPVGAYRLVISSPGYVTMELRRVDVTEESGLVLNLSLVEYPLHFDGRPEDFVPAEQPVPPGYRPPGS